MNVHVVANPTAGRGRVPPLLARLVPELERRGARVTVHQTTGPGDATAHVASLAPDACDRLAVIGGDGTLHEVVNGKSPPLPWPVAPVPVGTANLVGRDAGIPLRGDAARRADAVLSPHERVVDLLGTDRGQALAVVGVGFDAEIVAAVSRVRGVSTGGYARWVWPIAKTLVGYVPPRLTVRVDGGEPLAAGAVVVQNTFAYGGLFTLSPEARIDDGVLDVLLLRRAGRRDFARMLYRAWAGSLRRDHGVTLLRGTRVEIACPAPAPAQADGDPAGLTPLSVRILPRALRLVVPNAWPAA